MSSSCPGGTRLWEPEAYTLPAVGWDSAEEEGLPPAGRIVRLLISDWLSNQRLPLPGAFGKETENGVN